MRARAQLHIGAAAGGANAAGEELAHAFRGLPLEAGACLTQTALMGCASRHTLAPHPQRWAQREALSPSSKYMVLRIVSQIKMLDKEYWHIL